MKPLLHVWSLSIEEQYYLLLPAFLFFAPRKFWIPGSIALFLLSLGSCLALQTLKPIATFYLLPMRAWELGIGSLAAILAIQAQRVKHLFVVLFWPAVFTLVLVPLLPTGLPHPGLDAILVCMATAVVILRRHPLLKKSRVSRAGSSATCPTPLSCPLAAICLPQKCGRGPDHSLAEFGDPDVGHCSGTPALSICGITNSPHTTAAFPAQYIDWISGFFGGIGGAVSYPRHVGFRA
ncbi:MAG: acyltransferase [Propionivibrio sp.]|uniref:Acyltransferase n=1 Tax=Candidatus Propionivibrio dominans TaxID=2954373 RepID=A0A9D7FA41_9RHOO|nr:acyltransferase [Candidatus Propionivibrio dominans]